MAKLDDDKLYTEELDCVMAMIRDILAGELVHKHGALSDTMLIALTHLMLKFRKMRANAPMAPRPPRSKSS